MAVSTLHPMEAEGEHAATRRSPELPSQHLPLLRFGIGLASLLVLAAMGQVLAGRGSDSTAQRAAAGRAVEAPESPGGSPSATSTTAVTPSTTTTIRRPPGQVGVFTAAPGQTAVVGSGTVVTYSVEVEDATGEDPAAVGAIVDAALADPRSWIAGGTAFQRIPSGAQVRIVLATPPTVDQLCLPLQTNGIFSCKSEGQLNLNHDRWQSGTDDWPLSIEEYRAHVINHEMGHFLGLDHVGCPGVGELAPVMMQQTKGLNGCRANPWPHPEAAPPTTTTPPS